jgi:hypothetical protein
MLKGHPVRTKKSSFSQMERLVIRPRTTRQCNFLANAFFAVAERQIPAPVKAGERAAERLANRHKPAVQKVLRERAKLFRSWRYWQSQEREALLTGPYGKAAQELVEFLNKMTLDEGDGWRLLVLIDRGAWHKADPDARYEVRMLIGQAITRLRERNGLPPFDDSLPWGDESPNVWERAQRWLR